MTQKLKWSELPGGPGPFIVEKVEACSRPFPIHTHDFSELFIALGGSGTHVVNGRSYEITPGDVYALRGGTEHGFATLDSLAFFDLKYSNEWIQTLPGDIRRLTGFQSLFVIGPAAAEKTGFPCRTRLSSAELSRIEAIGDEMVREFREKRDGYLTCLHGAFSALAVHLSRAYRFQDDEASRTARGLATAVSHMERRFHEKISLRALADRSGFSLRHFIRLFTSHYRMAPGRYLAALRIEAAGRLLQGTKMRITDIALRSGYDDSNYFSRQFKRHTGLTPQAFREAPRIQEAPRRGAVV